MNSYKPKANDFNVKPAIVSYLLGVAKCDPNIRNYAGVSPIQLATYPFIVKDTIAHHAETDFYRWMEYHCEYDALVEIDHSFENHQLDLNQTASNGDTLLHIACVANKVHIVNYLFTKHNFNPNVKNNAGETPLILALKHCVYKLSLIHI